MNVKFVPALVLALGQAMHVGTRQEIVDSGAHYQFLVEEDAHAGTEGVRHTRAKPVAD